MLFFFLMTNLKVVVIIVFKYYQNSASGLFLGNWGCGQIECPTQNSSNFLSTARSETRESFCGMWARWIGGPCQKVFIFEYLQKLMSGLVFVEGGGQNILLHRELSARPVIVVCMLCYWKIACSKREGSFYVSEEVILHNWRPPHSQKKNCT